MRKLLTPLSWLYGGILQARNMLFDKQILKSQAHGLPTIVIGNLDLGGTGKTPHTILLASALSKEFEIAILSRGYGRKTKGFVPADEKSTAATIGDEPMIYWERFGTKIPVAVCEDRNLGIAQLRLKHPNLKAILLDDAYQHRKLAASFYLLLSDFNTPFFRQQVLPAGNLRDSKPQKNRAHAVVYSKMPPNAKIPEEFFGQFPQLSADAIFFSSITYGWPQAVFKNQIMDRSLPEDIVLFTAIANATPLRVAMEKKYTLHGHLELRDHKFFDQADFSQLCKILEGCPEQTCIFTTEKDAMRLQFAELPAALQNRKWLFIPIDLSFHDDSNPIALISEHISTFGT